MRVTAVHAEGARYRVRLIFLSGLWTPPATWKGVSSYLGHRGWEGEVLDLADVPGGIVARVSVVAEHVRRSPVPYAFVAHDAGGLVASHVAAAVSPAALVLLSPLDPATRDMRVLTRRWDAVAALVRGRPIPPPGGAAATQCFGPIPAEVLSQLVPEPSGVVLDVVRGRVSLTPPAVPTLVLAGAGDPLVPSAAAIATRIGAEHETLPTQGHWPIAGRGWQTTVAAVHRWLVRRLGGELLEFYDEAMAERDAGDDEPS